jgi:membrane protein YqaA with SNARE-associated domain
LSHSSNEDVSDAMVLLWISFVGTLFPPINPDAAAVLYVVHRGHPPLEAAAIAFVGQALMLLALHLAGARLRRHWGWLDRKCSAFQLRWGDRLNRSTLPVVALSGFFGLPPGVPTVIAAAALNLPAARYLPLFFFARALWFLALTFTGAAFAS